MLIGFSSCHSKPNINIFLTPIIKQLISLENIGMKCLDDDNQPQIIKFFTLFGIFDKPARRDVLNIIGSTGFFGCLRCLQPGETFDTANGIPKYFNLFCFVVLTLFNYFEVTLIFILLSKLIQQDQNAQHHSTSQML